MIDVKFTPELCGWIVTAIMPWLFLIAWPMLAMPWFLLACWFIWSQFVSKRYIDTAGKAVYITGCDSGFGHCIAITLAHRGFLVFAGCLKPFGPGAESLRQEGGASIVILDLDVTNDDKVNACADEIERTLNEYGLDGLWALYNNAGFATAGEIEWCSLQLYQKQIDVNLLGTIRVTKSVLKLIRQAKGRIVTISSGISRSANPGRSAYCISKYGVEAFMDCLRYEMHKFGVKCITIAPGNFTGVTNIFATLSEQLDGVFRKLDISTRNDYGQEYLEAFRTKVCGKYKSHGSPSSVSANDVVDAVKDAIMSVRPRARYKPMQPSWIIWSFIVELLPYDLTDKYVQLTMRDMPKPRFGLTKRASVG